jgi:large subunit ribosomal protein L18
MASTRREARQRRIRHIRKTVRGISIKPRLSVFRSNRYLFVQAIDDTKNRVLAALSEKTLTKKKGEKPVDRAERLGNEFGVLLKKAKIVEMVFDRGGYRFHGRIARFAEAVRKSGIKL